MSEQEGLKNNEEKIWDKYFNLVHHSCKNKLQREKKKEHENRRRHNFEIQKFQKNSFKFHYQIETDGFAVTVVYSKPAGIQSLNQEKKTHSNSNGRKNLQKMKRTN